MVKVTFLHPDLGIGGAERLVVDAALALRNCGHEIRIVTNQFSKEHCFEDLLTFKDITVIGGFPRCFFGKFNALCAYVRMCIAAIYICFKHDSDIIFCDQISAPLLLLRLFSSAKLFFYCHYPDQLLTKKESPLKKLYRFFIDNLEAWTTGMAHVIFVNSDYTKSVFRATFPSLSHKEVEILYPSLNTNFFDQEINCNSLEDFEGILDVYDHIFVSLNRFEVKKNIELAIRAFSLLRERASQEEFSKCLLVLAGGYDLLNKENIEYYQHLVGVVEELGLTDSVLFIKSPSDHGKIRLFQRAKLIVYTPENEHFGIVPLEAMYIGRPVLATNTGGPLETVVPDASNGGKWPQANHELLFFRRFHQAIKSGRVRITNLT
ncbi:glycosyl transferases group 1 domain-containing protein [Ditylenchus destructor]|nr:glycosyl transferases group 1 domain-containing protein [Ditylenchus destructor]